MSGADGTLFLDLSLSCGYAYATDLAACPEWGVIELPRGADVARGLQFVALENGLNVLRKRFAPARIALEAPIPAKSNPNGSDTIRLQMGLCAIVQAACYRWYLPPPVEVEASRARTAVCGRAHATPAEKTGGGNVKTAVVRPWLVSMWWDISDHNAADAAVGLAYVLGYRAKKGGGHGKRDKAPAAAG